MIFARLVCAIKGHDYSAKLIDSLQYVTCTMETCDRCGEGDADLAVARKEAKRVRRATDWTTARAYIIRMDYTATRELNQAAMSQARAAYNAYSALLANALPKPGKPST